MPLQGPMLARRWATASSASLDFHVRFHLMTVLALALCTWLSPHAHVHLLQLDSGFAFSAMTLAAWCNTCHHRDGLEHAAEVD